MFAKFFQSIDQNVAPRVTLFLCAILFALNFLFALPLLRKPMYSEADAYARAAMYPITQSGIFAIDGGVWLPLYQSFIDLAQLLPGNPLMMPRIITTLVASFVPVLIFLLTRTLTKQNDSSFIAAILCILFPLFREIGAATLTETFYLALFLSSLYFLLSDSYVHFGWLFLLSQMTRFESWFIVPWLMPIIIHLKKPSPIIKFILIGLCTIFPLFYSTMGYSARHNGLSYAAEMNEMANRVTIEGRNNFQVAISQWHTKFWEVVPVGYVSLFFVGLFAFIQQRQKHPMDDYREQFVFVVLPLFLFFMLPVQLFLPLRDWLPTRYLLIPTVLLFPLIGLGIQFLSTKFNWQHFWQWYVLGGLFLCFELYSLILNTDDLIATLTPSQFVELQETISHQVKNILTEQPSTLIYITNPVAANPDIPNINTEFVKYFLLPHHNQVLYARESELPILLHSSARKKIIISRSDQQFPSSLMLRKFFDGRFYDFLQY